MRSRPDRGLVSNAHKRNVSSLLSCASAGRRGAGRKYRRRNAAHLRFSTNLSRPVFSTAVRSAFAPHDRKNEVSDSAQTVFATSRISRNEIYGDSRPPGSPEILFSASSLPYERGSSYPVRSADLARALGKERYVNLADLPGVACRSSCGFSH